MAVSAARALGCPTIVSSSSGNAGAAVAAYAAKAGLRCIIFTVKGASGPMMAQMRAYGAKVVAVTNKADRWTLMSEAVREYNWFPTSPYFAPAVGSNPFGIEGYRTLAYEMSEALEWRVPDWIVVPVCYGDALIGLWRGFADMQRAGWTQRMPKLVAAEVYGSLHDALRAGGDTLPDMPKTHDTIATSITATQATYQSLKVLRDSGGLAVTLSNADLLRWQRQLAAQEGLFVEASSAGALVAIEKLRQNGTLQRTDLVVALNTASGLKAPYALDDELPLPIEVPADLAKASAILRERGIFTTRSAT
jgi:threonine synthase